MLLLYEDGRSLHKLKQQQISC